MRAFGSFPCLTSFNRRWIVQTPPNERDPRPRHLVGKRTIMLARPFSGTAACATRTCSGWSGASTDPCSAEAPGPPPAAAAGRRGRPRGLKGPRAPAHPLAPTRTRREASGRALLCVCGLRLDRPDRSARVDGRPGRDRPVQPQRGGELAQPPGALHAALPPLRGPVGAHGAAAALHLQPAPRRLHPARGGQADGPRPATTARSASAPGASAARSSGGAASWRRKPVSAGSRSRCPCRARGRTAAPARSRRRAWRRRRRSPRAPPRAGRGRRPRATSR